jgi:flagellar protein FlbD
MIRLTRLNHALMVLNSDLIEHIDVTPDTVITLTTGQILRVRETADEVIGRIVDFRRRVFNPDVVPQEADEELSRNGSLQTDEADAQETLETADRSR